MSRYLLLFLINLPFVLAAIVSAITQYKMGRSSKRRLATQLALWLALVAALALAQPIYEWLFTHQLTETEPLSLFDVVLFTGLVITFYIANRTRSKVEALEKRVRDLHQELSIILSKK